MLEAPWRQNRPVRGITRSGRRTRFGVDVIPSRHSTCQVDGRHHDERRDNSRERDAFWPRRSHEQLEAESTLGQREATVSTVCRLTWGAMSLTGGVSR